MPISDADTKVGRAALALRQYQHMALFRKQNPKDMWASNKDVESGSTMTRLRTEFQQSAGGVFQPARALFSESSLSAPARVVSLAEFLVELSVRPIGRIVTSTTALMLAWWLL